MIDFFFPHYQIQVQVLKEVKQVYVEENVFLEDHAKVREEYIEINEDLIVEKGPEIKIVETIKEDHFKIVNHKILQDIDFIGWFLFGEFCQLYEEHGKRIFVCPIDELQEWKEDKRLKYSKYLFALHGRFQITTINSRKKIYSLIFVVYYFWYFHVIFGILGLRLLFPWF